MTTPRTKAPRAGDAAPPARPVPATQLAVPVGPRVVDVLELAYRARRPLLLEGPTGIGKSQIVSEFARAAGLAYSVLDLSLLEPPDLVGLPVIEGGRTRYAAPAELPTTGRGVLMLEELNRAEVPVMQPALQLLSARRLHAYELPPGWTCVAAVNPEDGDYQVNRLDPALRSRFLQLHVCADRDAWLGWAARSNVHPTVARVVAEHPDAFDHASPRSWTYASDVVHEMRDGELADRELVRVALRGYLPAAWAIVVGDALAGQTGLPALDLAQVLQPRALAAIVAPLEKSGRMDAIAVVAARVRRLLAGPDLAARADAGAITLAALEQALAALPGDLREQCLETAVESAAGPALLRGLGHAPEAIVAAYVGSPLAAEVAACRRELRVYRVRLVVAAVLRYLTETALPPATLAACAPHVAALARDAGPLGADLARWLAAHEAA
jgi:MoxR-like ATPase|nr:MoxR family ATPase [Kofleriaceae bacterium]